MAILSKFPKNRPVILDGAMGTALQSMGLPLGVFSATCNHTHPEWVHQVHQKYLTAGADIIFTNTFGVFPQNFSNWKSITTVGISLAREATKKGDGLVAGCLGPLGILSLAEENYVQQVSLMLEQGVDMLVLETMVDAQEAKLATSIVRQLSSQIPLMVLVHVDESACLPDGTSPALLARHLVEEGADILGVNCSTSLLAASKAILAIQKEVKAPLALKPARHKNDFSQELCRIGKSISLIGGCCHSTPEDIKYLHENHPT